MTEFTNPNDYQKQAARTECSQGAALGRIIDLPLHNRLQTMRLLHGIIGLMGELGELAGAVERWIWYGQDFDGENFVEELGDSQWYMAELHNALDVSMLEVMRANIRKLRSRYPEKFDQELAKEENRNREEEMKAALGPPRYLKEFEEQTGQGFAEPPEELPPETFFTKEQIDKALEGQASFAMKDFKGFPPALGSEEFYQSMGVPPEVFKGSLPRPVANPVDPPYLYGKSRELRPGEEIVQCVSRTVRPGEKLELPEDGWTVARKIATTFVDGQNLAYALKSIDSFEKQRREYEAGLIKDYVNSPFGDLPL